MGLGKRIVGAVIGGGGSYALLHFVDPLGLPASGVPVVAGVMALIGFVVGAKVWEVVVALT